MSDASIDIDKAIVATIAWNSRGWRGPSDNPVDWEEATFQEVRNGGHAHEWWNFYVDHPNNTDGYVYGYFNVSGNGTPRIEPEETVAVVFASHEPVEREMYIVGLYLGANYNPDGWPGVEEKGEGRKTSWSRLRCPRELVWIAEPKRLLRLDNSRHLKGKRIGRRGFTYIGEKHLRRIMKDLADARAQKATSFMARTRFS